jgi:primosomal protein N' (replication factor Y)
MANVPLILGSATPSIQSYYRAKSGLYTLIELTERVQSRPMPKIQIVDMREEFLRGNNSIFSSALLNALKICLGAGKQAILFINRRGYSTFVSCRGCGHVFGCVNCDVSMTYHRTEERVKCHYCGHTEPVPTVCPVCGRPVYHIFGVGTQRWEEHLHTYFPGVAALRMDMEVRAQKTPTSSSFAFARGEAQAVIGTQMVAKGLDFPNVRWWAWWQPDYPRSSILIYRSAERTFQLLTQLRGPRRTDEDPGRVVVQHIRRTPRKLCPHARLQRVFTPMSWPQRRAALFPPFSLFVRALFTGLEEAPLRADGERFATGLEQAVLAALGAEYAQELLILHASEAPIYKKQGVYRYQVLIKLLRTGILRRAAGNLRLYGRTPGRTLRYAGNQPRRSVLMFRIPMRM